MTAPAPQRDGEVVHLTGPCITWDGRWMRQRCVWCGAVIVAYDLTTVAVAVPKDGTPPAGPSGFPQDAFVHVDGGAKWTDDVDVAPAAPGKVPERSCMRLDPEVTA